MKPSDFRAPYGEVYTNRKFAVIDNGSDEIIVRRVDSDGNTLCSVRLTPHSGEISVITQDSKFILYHINGLNGVITSTIRQPGKDN